MKSTETKVTRISASDSAPKKKILKLKKSTKSSDKKEKKKSKRGVMRVLRAIGGYFKGAWIELGQVRWPDRKATWGMTGALLAFTAFFVIIILLLDAGFKYLFNLLIGA